MPGTKHNDAYELGPLKPAVDATLARLESEGFARRLWSRDAALWKSEPEHQRIIRNALGWLTVADDMQGNVKGIRAFAEEVRLAGFRDAVVLGMGGSSLCPDVCRATFGSKPGYPKLHILDSTVPGSVIRLTRNIEVARTLFLVSSKSGGTVESNSFFKYFYELEKAEKKERAGENFVAITDPGTSLEKLAADMQFRHVFPGHPDIGGRYSALSNFGMVPAALAGTNIEAMLGKARQMAEACAANVPTSENPGIKLGVVMGEAALAGLDKITFALSPGICNFGDWVEQLIAESTGKEGKGILPIVGEPRGETPAYGEDRLFVYLRLRSEADAESEKKLDELQGAGHPVVRLELDEKLDLGGEFLRWEIATATAGAVLGINPFDQPNVQESKDNTKALLGRYRAEGKLPQDAPTLEEGGLAFYGGLAAQGDARLSPAELVMSFLGQVRKGDYVAMLAYLAPTRDCDLKLNAIRVGIRDALRVGTTAGYGPRYLHSTGQLHKGGGNKGVFVEITGEDAEDSAIPGEPYSFSVLKQAQALGDLRSLQSKNRRVLRLHLKHDAASGLARLRQIITGAAKQIPH